MPDYRAVVFTGGEPTLAFDVLLGGIERATQHGLTTRLVSNASWAVNGDVAARKSIALKSAGLAEINFSTGDQHVRFVPIDRVVRAIRAAYEADIKTIAVMVEVVSGRVITRESLTAHPNFVKFQKQHRGAKIHITESPWMPLSPAESQPYPPGLVANLQNVASRSGCDSVLTTTTVQADGQISSCCGLGSRLIPELYVGHVDDTSIEEADHAGADDFLKRWIRAEGPERILAWAATHDDSIDWENRYAHRCQACLRIYGDRKVRRVIKSNYSEKFADVVSQEWLLHHYRDSEPAVTLDAAEA